MSTDTSEFVQSPGLDEPAGEITKIQKPSLPAPGELRMKRSRKLNLSELVLPVFDRLYNTNETFVLYLKAISNDEAVERNIKDDNTMAAHMIREAASDDSPIKSATLGQLRSALRVVMGWHEISRIQRQREYAAAIEAAKPFGQPAAGDVAGDDAAVA